jgi:hypothetical protein
MSKLLVLLSVMTAFAPDLVADTGVATSIGWVSEVSYFGAARTSPWQTELTSLTSPTRLCSCENCPNPPSPGEPCTCDLCGIAKSAAPATKVIFDGLPFEKRVLSNGSLLYTPISDMKRVEVSRGQVQSVTDGYVVPMMQFGPASRCYIDAYGRRVCQ